MKKYYVGVSAFALSVAALFAGVNKSDPSIIYYTAGGTDCRHFNNMASLDFTTGAVLGHQAIIVTTDGSSYTLWGSCTKIPGSPPTVDHPIHLHL